MPSYSAVCVPVGWKDGQMSPQKSTSGDGELCKCTLQKRRFGNLDRKVRGWYTQNMLSLRLEPHQASDSLISESGQIGGGGCGCGCGCGRGGERRVAVG
jgi:hypothetical protein